MFSMPGGWEWIIILVVVFVVFGAGKLPDVMKQFGRGIREFKDAAAGEEETTSAEAAKARKQLNKPDELDDEEEAPAKDGDRVRSKKG